MLHGIVPIIAACSYLAMATGQGLVTLPRVGGAILAGETAPTRIFYLAQLPRRPKNGQLPERMANMLPWLERWS